MFTSHSSVVVIFGPVNGFPSYRVQGPILEHREPGKYGSLGLYHTSPSDPEFTAVDWQDVPAETKTAMQAAHKAACDSLIASGMVEAPAMP